MPLRIYICQTCQSEVEKLLPGFEPPNIFPCENCGAKMFLNKVNRVAMQPDEYWSGKQLEHIGLNNVTSKSYLKRYLRDNKLAQLTSDEIAGHRPTQKTHKERIEEFHNKPEIVRARKDAINQALNDHGVI